MVAEYYTVAADRPGFDADGQPDSSTMPVPGRKLCAATYSNAYSHCKSNAYGHINTYPVAAAFSHAYCDIHAYAHEYSNANSSFNTNGNPYPNTNSISCA